jgi:malate permease and related proteins
MQADIFTVIAPVFLCAVVGFLWAKRGERFEVAFVTRLVTFVGFPCLVFTTLVKAEITAQAMGVMGFASLATLAAFAAVAVPVLKLANLDRRAFLPAMIFANTGNMGLPLCLLAFGEEGLAFGISYFTVNSIILFILGPAIATGDASPARVLREPLVWSVALALVVKLADIPVPEWLFRSLDLIGGFAIPLMLIALGVSLADLKIASLGRSVSLSVFRLAMGFLVGWGAAALLGYEGAARGVLIIECAMPAAVFSYVYAQLHNTQPQEIAGVVLISTLLSFATLPALLWFVIPG